jgi:hypothetical protein
VKEKTEVLQKSSSTKNLQAEQNQQGSIQTVPQKKYKYSSLVFKKEPVVAPKHHLSMSPDLRLKRVEILPAAEYNAKGISRPQSKTSLVKMIKNEKVHARSPVFDQVSGGANSEDFEDAHIEEPSKAHLSNPFNYNLKAS